VQTPVFNADNRCFAVALGPLDPIVACGLEALLRSDPRFEVLPGEGLSLDRLPADCAAHVVVVDDRAQRATLVRLRATRPTVGLLVLGGDPRPADVALLVGMGVGCVPRDASLQEIRSALHLAALGSRSLAGDGFLDGRRSEVSLTRREIDVLGCLADRRSHKQIAEELQISVRTVHAHVARIHRKLGVRSSRELLSARPS
jgi:two-component system response regulator NreC